LISLSKQTIKRTKTKQKTEKYQKIKTKFKTTIKKPKILPYYHMRISKKRPKADMRTSKSIEGAVCIMISK